MRFKPLSFRNTMNNSALFKTSAICLVCSTLLACGGGGGDEVAVPITPVTPISPKLSDAQGFWSAALGADSRASAIILPNGQAWVVYESTTEGVSSVTALAQATLSLNGNSYSSIGKHYSLPFVSASTPASYNFSGMLSSTASTTLANTVTVGSGTPAAVTWTYNKAYETPVTQASAQGNWRSPAGSSISLSWTIDSNGSLSTASSSTGCSYSGKITPNPGAPAVLEVAVTETCAGVAQVLAGVATLNAAKTGMSLAYTTLAGTAGGVWVLVK